MSTFESENLHEKTSELQRGTERRLLYGDVKEFKRGDIVGIRGMVVGENEDFLFVSFDSFNDFPAEHTFRFLKSQIEKL